MGKDVREDRYVIAVPLKGEVAKHYFNKTISNPAERDVPAFQKYWKFNEKTGEINGSSTYLTLRLARELGKDSFWIPSVSEARALDKAGKLKNGVYSDYGIAVFDDSEPNKKTAKTLIEQAKSMKLVLPLLVPFSSLDYQLDRESDFGIALSLSDAKGIISGEDAVKLLEQFDYKSNSSVCRLDRGRYGDWVANWDGLDDSYFNGRAGFVCGEAAHADLAEAHKKLVKRKYAQKSKEFEEQIKSLREQSERDEVEFAKQLV